jgi:hypothetical protein
LLVVIKEETKYSRKTKEELKGGVVCSTYQLGACWQRWRREEAGMLDVDGGMAWFLI